MTTSENSELSALIKRSAKSFLFFFVVSAMAMVVTSFFAALLSLFGLDYWARLERVVGLGSPGALYVLASTWMVLAALYFSFPEWVQSLFQFATNTFVDLWFSVLGALAGAAFVFSVVLRDLTGLIWALIFVAFSYALIVGAHRWLNPKDFTFVQRLGLSALILLLIPVFLVLA
ncbi:hypothetical protein ACVCNR_14955 [Aquamicrobium terrae]